ncbi:MAG: RNA-binding S4 domain-containing protein [Trueperaceae bacterium]|nr:RNA-binding S4 domain-containing protein [Trueperaceae bacterium]
MSEDFLTLNDMLKLSGIAQTGGQAKLLIQGGEVRVNGEVETRRKRKLKQGDVVEVHGEEYLLELEELVEDNDYDDASLDD